MGRKKEQTALPTPEPEPQLSNLPAQVGPAGILRVPERHSTIPIPPHLQGATMREAPSGLSPTVQFENPGQWFVGRYLGLRQAVGPNKSQMYDMATKEGEVVAVWGSTILDRKLQLVDPKRGDILLIQYLGDVETSRGMNPAKDFRVAVLTPGPQQPRATSGGSDQNW